MVKIWINPVERDKPSHERRTSDGPYRIVVTSLNKSRQWSDHRIDEWPMLRRSDVPHLTEADWYACPGEGWIEEEEEVTPCL